jgi:regulatory Fis family protein
MSTSLLGSLAHAEPQKAKQRILHALERTHGDRKKAAELLDVQHRSFYRIVERLRMWNEIDEMMERKGFPQIPGPSRTPKRIRDAVLAAEGSLPRAARSLNMSGEESLRERIDELGLWTDINKVLRAAGLAGLERAQPAA